MSQIPSDALSYRAVVSEYFLQLRGAGLLLSPLDDQLVAEWERRGVPAAVVCRGLRRGFEELDERRPPGAGPQRSLRALRGYVEEEWRAYKEGRVGESLPPGAEAPAAAARLAQARLRLAEAAAASIGMRRAAYLEVAAHLPAEPADLREAERALRAADDRLLARWLASLSRAERSALGPRCRLLAGDRSRRARRSAYRETLRSHLFEAARRAGVLCLRGTV
ncbi:MAG TPA: hypothetical protein VMT17_17445 [Anaeromyxobacteraceae bacterium]|nr:hypothetical protein [Anaeromyxobacteraceae bacterium]